MHTIYDYWEWMDSLRGEDLTEEDWSRMRKDMNPKEDGPTHDDEIPHCPVDELTEAETQPKEDMSKRRVMRRYCLDNQGEMTSTEREYIISAFVVAAVKAAEVTLRGNSVVVERINRVGEFMTQLRRKLTEYGSSSARRFIEELTRKTLWYDILELRPDAYVPSSLKDLPAVVEEAMEKLDLESGDGPDSVELGLVTLRDLCKDCNQLNKQMDSINEKAEKVMQSWDKLAQDMEDFETESSLLE